MQKTADSNAIEDERGSTLQPSFEEENGLNRFNSDLIGFLSSDRKISLEDFIENILEEIPGASQPWCAN